jgi:hypothetical protein
MEADTVISKDYNQQRGLKPAGFANTVAMVGRRPIIANMAV